MTLKPGPRKFVLLVHLLCSVGWFGSVAVFASLATRGFLSDDGGVERAVYLALRLMTWTVIVPLSLASVVSGIVASIGTPWGLFRYYWVIAKLVLTLAGTGLLLLHTRAIDWIADATLRASIVQAGAAHLKLQLLADSVAALVLLAVITGFSVYKPRGVTSYGQRHLRTSADESQNSFG